MGLKMPVPEPAQPQMEAAAAQAPVDVNAQQPLAEVKPLEVNKPAEQAPST